MTQSTDEKREGGQEEYLASYDISAYDRPSVTADAVISDPAGRILLVKRKNHPYKGCWALPGGFVNRNETTAEAAVREAAGAAVPFDILPAVWVSSLCSVTAGLLTGKVLARIWP